MNKETNTTDNTTNSRVDLKLLLNNQHRGINIDKLERGIRDTITGSSESGEELLRLLLPGHTLQASQMQRIQEARTNLIEDYGFCSCCVDKLMEYAAAKLPKSDTKGNDKIRRALGF